MKLNIQANNQFFGICPEGSDQPVISTNGRVYMYAERSQAERSSRWLSSPSNGSIIDGVFHPANDRFAR